MKKAFALVVLIVAPTMAFAQGTVAFINDASGLVQQWTSLTDHTLIPVPKSGGWVELIAAPAGTALSHPLFTRRWGDSWPDYSSLAGFLAANPGWEAFASTPISSLAAGRFNGGTVTITGIGAGANADYFVLGWTGNYTTWDAAYAAMAMTGGSFLGMSAIATTATGNPTTTPPEIPVVLRDTFTGMTLPTVPEPSSLALAGLGLAALLTFRRRN